MTTAGPTSLTTTGIENLLRDAESAERAARGKDLAKQGKAQQQVTVLRKALQFAQRRDRQVAAGQDSADAAAKLADRVDHYLRIEATPEHLFRDLAFTVK